MGDSPPPLRSAPRPADAASGRIGIVVGLAAEARIARPLGWTVAIGGGSAQGAEAAAMRLVASGVSALVSFGLAGGLDPALRPGSVLVPDTVLHRGQRLLTDLDLSRRLGGPTADVLLGAEVIAATAEAKRRLHTQHGVSAIDLESGAMARVAAAQRLPFAVLRAVCDPAGRDLPPAALLALDHQGVIGLTALLRSLLHRPAQLPALLALAVDAARARRALVRRVASIRS